MFFINVSGEEEKCTEAQLDILLKINTGEYRLVKKNKRSSVWNVYREIARADGSKLKWRYFCLGCKRVMQSTGGTTSNLRIHKCHVRYLKQNGNALSTGQRKFSSRRRELGVQREDFCQIQSDTISECEDLIEDAEETGLEEDNIAEEDLQLEINQETSSKSRPLLKLFSEDSCSDKQELDEDHINETGSEEQRTIELDHNQMQHPATDFKPETPPSRSNHDFDTSAIAEAESYAKAWTHAFLRLNDEQKFYAKRSIDELLVLGRLQKLSISTVTSLSTNF
ncbi:uncharacterized protein [Drosophila bipectinata]|uniref:uncharacterized protein n=1 Tax=Drosophila bipectinata TaxID=42026 RepID=UPI001C89AEDD|nr:uncharacterized protein LOC108120419 [Drosophila bipectinata]